MDILDALRHKDQLPKQLQRVEDAAAVMWRLSSAAADEIERLRAEVAALQDQRREMHADMSDLAMLVRRLALALRKAQPEHSTVSDAAMEFLRKRGLDGEVLR